MDMANGTWIKCFQKQEQKGGEQDAVCNLRYACRRSSDCSGRNFSLCVVMWMKGSEEKKAWKGSENR